MDYSQFTSKILSKYLFNAISTVIAIACLIWAIVYLIKKFLLQNAEKGDLDFLFFRSKDSVISLCFAVGVFILLLIFLFWFCKVVLDIPYLVEENYSVSTGIVVSHDSSGREDISVDRGFSIKDFESGKTLTFHVHYTPIREGEIYEVVYLPNTKNGAIVRKIENVE